MKSRAALAIIATFVGLYIVASWINSMLPPVPAAPHHGPSGHGIAVVVGLALTAVGVLVVTAGSLMRRHYVRKPCPIPDPRAEQDA